MKVSNDSQSLNLNNNLQTPKKIKSSSESKTNMAKDGTAENGVKVNISNAGMDLQNVKTTSEKKINISVDSQRAERLDDRVDEGKIKDKDMAQELMELTKKQILNQPKNALLAQANQTPQNVFSLLE